MFDGLTFAVRHQDAREGVRVPEDVKDLMTDIALSGKRHYASYKTIGTKLFKEFQNRPQTVLKLIFIKAIRSWYGTDTNRYENSIFVAQAGYLFFIILATIKALLLDKNTKHLVICIWLLVFYFWAMSISVVPLLRYMTQSMGILFILLPAIYKHARGERCYEE
ncbi:hypothetical protein ACFL0T_02885 [Candidatus Omnitrophota bacterium]